MRNIINQAPLSRPLLLKASLGSIAITNLMEAGSFIQQHGNENLLHWQVAADAADKDSKLIGHATSSIENALKTDQMLAWRCLK
jgi:hypothetical protein